jgi:hypothetical protein
MGKLHAPYQQARQSWEHRSTAWVSSAPEPAFQGAANRGAERPRAVVFTRSRGSRPGRFRERERGPEVPSVGS